MYRHFLILGALLISLSGWTASGWAADPDYRADVVTGKAGSRDLHLDLCLPAAGTKPFPLLVWIHGGGWHGGSRHDYRDLMRGFTDAGYASASLEYRFPPRSPLASTTR